MSARVILSRSITLGLTEPGVGFIAATTSASRQPIRLLAVMIRALLLSANEHLGSPFGELDRLLCEWLFFLGVLDLQGLGRLSVGVGFQQVLDLREDGGELLVRIVVGLGCDVTAQVFQLVMGEQHRSVGGRGSDSIGNLVVDVDGFFEEELPLSHRQPEPEMSFLSTGFFRMTSLPSAPFDSRSSSQLAQTTDCPLLIEYS